MLALSEAAATLALEMIPTSEPDILRPELGLSIVAGDPQSARAARAVFRVLLRPGSLRADPAAVFERCTNAARITQLVYDDDGDCGRMCRPSEHETASWREGRARFAECVPRLLHDAPPPIAGAFAAARLAAACLPDPQPMTERLVFMAAEHEFRRDLVLSDPVVSREVPGLDPRIDAAWVCPPSLALTQGSLRAWDIGTASARARIVGHLYASLGREVGRLGPLSGWSARLDADFRGKTARSRRGDFVRLVRATPILDARTTATALGITERAARNLLEDAEDLGLLTELTARPTCRIWAAPMLAELIRDRARPSLRQRRTRAEAPRVSELPARPVAAADPDFGARIDDIMGDIDRALENLDATLDRHRARRQTAERPPR